MLGDMWGEMLWLRCIGKDVSEDILDGVLYAILLRRGGGGAITYLWRLW